MTLFFICVTAYFCTLAFYVPQPESLRERRPSVLKNIYQIKVSILVGLSLFLIFLVVSRFEFDEVDRHLNVLFGFVNVKEVAVLWPMQIFTHLLIHENAHHVIANVFAIGLASAYERRVGSKRFFMVLVVGALFSVPSVFFYPTPTVASGISGGVFALGLAFVTDHENLPTKDWFGASLMYLALAGLVSFFGESKLPSLDETTVRVDHVGHMLGALGGVLYCRFRPLRPRALTGAAAVNVMP